MSLSTAISSSGAPANSPAERSGSLHGNHPPGHMELPAAAKRELESILGPRDISDDPAILAGYAWILNGSGGDPPERLMSITRPTAIVLPESTEEVQAVVKTCLRHGLKFRAHSTGVGSFGNVANEGTVSIDLRKMNRIVEIDANNQMAVIEPYVTAAQLQAESLKVGLTPHIIGAGWTHSPLASATSLMGVGPSGNHTGNNPRNMLAVEWITPDGELVRLGAAGAGSGWFAGEGPGPGFRGMIRGFVGALGELGVFTRIGYKLHPWMGPRQLEHCGSNPQWGIRLTETMRVYHLVWDDWDAATEATYELLHSNAATFIARIPADQQGWILYPTNREFYDHWRSGEIPDVARNENRICWTLLAVSESLAEAEWRERVIRRIAEASAGRIMPLEQSHAETIARNMTTSCFAPRAFRPAPKGLFTSFGVMDSPRMLPGVIQSAEKVLKPYKEKHRTLGEGGPEELWLWTSEGRQLWGENVIAADNSAVDSWADSMTVALEGCDENVRNPLGINAFALSKDLVDTFYSQFDTHLWIRKLKMEFDPHRRSDGKVYPYGAISSLARSWPVMKWVLRLFPLAMRLSVRARIHGATRAQRREAKRRYPSR